MKNLSKKNSYSPLSADWSLYKPEVLAKKLDLGTISVDKALEETGFNKAVRIREHLIRWKVRLLHEQKKLFFEKRILINELRKMKQREKEIREQLTNIRNILRISREKI